MDKVGWRHPSFLPSWTWKHLNIRKVYPRSRSNKPASWNPKSRNEPNHHHTLQNDMEGLCDLFGLLTIKAISIQVLEQDSWVMISLCLVVVGLAKCAGYIATNCDHRHPGHWHILKVSSFWREILPWPSGRPCVQQPLRMNLLDSRHDIASAIVNYIMGRLCYLFIWRLAYFVSTTILLHFWVVDLWWFDLNGPSSVVQRHDASNKTVLG